METGHIFINPLLSDIPPDFGESSNFGFDTETYGVRFKDRAFAYQLSDGKYTLYFNMKSYKDAPWVGVANVIDVAEVLRHYLKDAERVFIANAKFDMLRLDQIGLDPLEYNVYCNHALHRLIVGQAEDCKLESQGVYWGFPKDKRVEEYIKKNGLYTKQYAFGFEMGKLAHYDLVPFSIIQPYGCRDAWLSLTIGLKQIDFLQKSRVAADLVRTEVKLTKVLYKMEKRGIKVDLAHVEERINHHIQGRTEAINNLGVGFTDGKTYLLPVFKKHGLPVEYNPKTHEPLFKSTILEKYPEIEEIKQVLEYRHHHKLLKSFYLKLWTMHEDGVIHTDFNQYAAKTGRISSRNPSLLNLPSRAGNDVKKSFIPFEGKEFLVIDHSQAELRLTYDISKQMNMVERFKRDEDMHETLAKMVNVDRFIAKTAIFALIYGSGVRGISNLIKMPIEKTRQVVLKIKQSLPKVWALEQQLKSGLAVWGSVRNIKGRIIELSKADNYKILNHYIQGSLADIVKEEIVSCDIFLSKDSAENESFISLSVHDSIIFQIDAADACLQTRLVDIMENTYISESGLKLKVDVENGKYNYGDTRKGYCF